MNPIIKLKLFYSVWTFLNVTFILVKKITYYIAIATSELTP